MTKSRILKSTPYKNSLLSSVVIHALATGKGITWLDRVRIPYKIGDRLRHNEPSGSRLYYDRSQYPFKNSGRLGGTDAGRFPANLLCSDDVLNDGEIRASCKSTKHHEKYGDNSILLDGDSHPGNQYNDSGSYSRYFDLDKWWSTLLERIKHENSDI